MMRHKHDRKGEGKTCMNTLWMVFEWGKMKKAFSYPIAWACTYNGWENEEKWVGDACLVDDSKGC